MHDGIAKYFNNDFAVRDPSRATHRAAIRGRYYRATAARLPLVILPANLISRSYVTNQDLQFVFACAAWASIAELLA